MTESILPAGGVTPNPAIGNVLPPASQGQPPSANPPVINPLETKVAELSTQIETVTRQYKGSTEEALRLKEENEKLKKEIGEVKIKSELPSEEQFQNLVDKWGLRGAIEQLFAPKVASLEEKINALVTKDANQLLETFKSSHPALLDAAFQTKFNAELSVLRDAYKDINEAMERAYILAGGTKLEASPVVSQPKVEAISGLNPVTQVTGGADDKRPVPAVTDASVVQTKIADLTYQAAILERQGRSQSAAILYAQIEDLRVSLKK